MNPKRGAMLLALLLSAGPLLACDLCPQKGTPLYRELPNAPIVVFGHVARAQLLPDNIRGTSELHVEALLKDTTGKLKGKSGVTMYRYLPPNPNIKFLVLAELIGGQFDPYRSFQFSSDRVLGYLKNAPKETDPQALLRYAFDFLNDGEPEIAGDAFAIWANSTNQDVQAVASKLAPEKLRSLLMDGKTPAARLGLFAYLLGACGKETDAELLRKLIAQPDERFAPAMDGLLGGYIQLRPAEGWKLAKEILASPERPFTQKHATLRMLRFYHSAARPEHLKEIIECLGILVQNPGMLDLAIDQLRQWKLWNHTPAILKAFESDAAQSIMTRRSIVRYALTCPDPAAKDFIGKLKKSDPKLVDEVEADLPLFDEPIKVDKA